MSSDNVIETGKIKILQTTDSVSTVGHVICTVKTGTGELLVTVKDFEVSLAALASLLFIDIQ